MLPQHQAERIIDKVLAASRAESISAALYASHTYDLRFAVNTVTTCGSSDSVSLFLSSSFGQRTGSVSTTALDDASLEAAVRQSEELAQLAPENPEFMPPLDPQQYLKVEAFDEDTASATPQRCTDAAAGALRLSRSREVDLSGFLTIGTGNSYFANSSGLRAQHRATQATYATTARTRTGRGSHKVQLASHRLGELKLDELSGRAIERAFEAQNPIELPPGRYPTILEPSACADMLGFLFMHMNRRSADEGRSYFSESEGRTKLGQKMFADCVHLSSDPQFALAPTSPWGQDGVPLGPVTWAEQGELRELFVDRYWAKKTNCRLSPFPSNVIMRGSSKSLAQLIASCERAVLVTNLWYIRDVDPQKLLITGLTRDGIFLVEDGKVKSPIKNFRFNESPAEMLKNVVDVGTAGRAVGNEMEQIQFVVPALKLSSFNFSTLSDAV